jgi:hypothetical protein
MPSYSACCTEETCNLSVTGATSVSLSIVAVSTRASSRGFTDRVRVMRHLAFVVITAVALSTFASAAAAVDVACASLLADEVLFAETQMQVGSRVPQRRGRPVTQVSPARDNLVAVAMVQAVTVATQKTAESVALSGESVARYRAMSLERGSDVGVAAIGEVAKSVAKATGAQSVYIAAKLTFRYWRADSEILVGVGAYGNVGQTMALDTAVSPFVGVALLQYDASGRLQARRDVV